jgi:N-acetylmuramoyl-L-alanine amidase
MRDIKYLVVHCTATPEGKTFTAKDINLWHKQKGWSGIGYHYVIALDGSIESGRPEHQIGAHVQGYNDNSLGIVYVGGCDAKMQAKDTRTLDQKTALIKLLKQLKLKHPKAVILGHRDFPKVAKACPSFNASLEYSKL